MPTPNQRVGRCKRNPTGLIMHLSGIPRSGPHRLQVSSPGRAVVERHKGMIAAQARVQVGFTVSNSPGVKLQMPCVPRFTELQAADRPQNSKHHLPECTQRRRRAALRARGDSWHYCLLTASTQARVLAPGSRKPPGWKLGISIENG